MFNTCVQACRICVLVRAHAGVGGGARVGIAPPGKSESFSFYGEEGPF